MKRRALLALAVAPLLPGFTRPAGAQSIHPGNWQQYFRIESEAGKDKKGQESDKLFDVTFEFTGMATSHESCKK